MKNFLKSTAIFACIALMFCACSEDTTEDLQFEMVEASTIDEIVSGDGRAILKWTVPDDETIAQCYVRFTNEIAASDEYPDGVAASVNEVRYIDVVPGYPTQYEFTDLPAGTYTATINNLAEGRILVDVTGATAAKHIYTIDDYTSRPTAMRVVTTNTGVTVTWSGIPTDCRGIYVTYTDNFEETKTTGLLSEVSVGASSPVSYFEDMQPGSTFNYITAFIPDDGLDTVYLEPSLTSTSVQDFVAKDPTSVSAASGYKSEGSDSPGTPSIYLDGQYMQVKWTVPSNDFIVYSVVSYSLLNDAGNPDSDNTNYWIKFGGVSEDELGDYTEADGVYQYGFISGYGEEDMLKESNVNIRYIASGSTDGAMDTEKELKAGRYYVTVHNEKAGGLVSTKVAADTLTVYTPDSFVMPTISEIVNDAGIVTIAWDDAPSGFQEATLTYTNTSGGTSNATVYSLEDTILDTNLMKELTDVTVSVTYKPDNFNDNIVIVNYTFVIVPQYAPYAPTNVVAYPGYTETSEGVSGDPFIRVEFDLTGTDDTHTVANQAAVYYTDEYGNTYSKEYTLTEDGLSPAGSNSYDIYDNIVAGRTYTVEVSSANKETTMNNVSYSSRIEAPEILAYDETSYVLPTVESISFALEDGATVGTAYLNWASAAYTDFKQVDVTYSDGLTASATTLSESTSLPNAVAGSTYTFVASFQPSNGVGDPVSYNSVNFLSDDQYLYETPTDPLTASAAPGSGYIRVSYTLPVDDYIHGARVVCIGSDGTELTEYTTSVVTGGATNIYDFYELTAGVSYSVTVSSMRTDDTVTPVFSTAIDAGTVTVYNLAEFTATCVSAPTIASYEFNDHTKAISIYWNGISDANHPTPTRVDLTHAYDASDLTKTMTSQITTISSTTAVPIFDVMPGNDYSYYGVFKPSSNAIDEVKVGPFTGTFDNLVVAKAYMWTELSSAQPTASYLATSTLGGSGYLVNGSHNYTKDQIEAAVFPGDYVPQDYDNYYSSDSSAGTLVASTWCTYEMFDDNLNQGTSTGTYAYNIPYYYTGSDGTTEAYSLVKLYDGGVTVDLSGLSDSDYQYAYKLTKFTLWNTPAGSSAFSEAYARASVKRFSLYGTNDPDPASNPDLTMVDDSGLPVMDNWTKLLDSVWVLKPSVGYYDSSYDSHYLDLDYWDANGDGIVDMETPTDSTADDWSTCDDHSMYAIGWSFDIPETQADGTPMPPVRYIRMILHENYGGAMNTTHRFRIQEIELEHKGYELCN